MCCLEPGMVMIEVSGVLLFHQDSHSWHSFVPVGRYTHAHTHMYIIKRYPWPAGQAPPSYSVVHDCTCFTHRKIVCKLNWDKA